MSTTVPTSLTPRSTSTCELHEFITNYYETDPPQFIRACRKCGKPQFAKDESLPRTLQPLVPKCRVFTPLSPNLPPPGPTTRVFLAGTIDMGHSHDWQQDAIQALRSVNVHVFNPRLRQTEYRCNTVDIQRQIQWELKWLHEADVILMNIFPGSESPISLLEFGLFVTSPKMLVVCPPEYKRAENIYQTIQYTEQAFGADNCCTLLDSVEEAIATIKEVVEEQENETAQTSVSSAAEATAIRDVAGT